MRSAAALLLLLLAVTAEPAELSMVTLVDGASFVCNGSPKVFGESAAGYAVRSTMMIDLTGTHADLAILRADDLGVGISGRRPFVGEMHVKNPQPGAWHRDQKDTDLGRHWISSRRGGGVASENDHGWVLWAICEGGGAMTVYATVEYVRDRP